MTASRTALLEGARRGEQAAWDDLVSDFSSLVWSIARGYRLPDEDAADAVQMTWLRLVENLDRIRDAERLPGGWPRPRGASASRCCVGPAARSPPSTTHLSSPSTPPHRSTRRLLLDERDRAVWSAFSVLGERCRRLLRVLMASPPPSYREVSAALAMPVGSIGPTRQRLPGGPAPHRPDRCGASRPSWKMSRDERRRRGAHGPAAPHRRRGRRPSLDRGGPGPSGVPHPQARRAARRPRARQWPDTLGGAWRRAAAAHLRPG